MALYFFDSSALIKRYVSETGTPWVIGLTDPANVHGIYIARIAGAEVVSALTRRQRGGSITMADLALTLADFRQDFTNGYRIIEITESLIARAMSLAESHALRGYDAVQLAAATALQEERLLLGLPAPALISADISLNTAAAEGLSVEDPNNH